MKCGDYLSIYSYHFHLDGTQYILVNVMLYVLTRMSEYT